MVAVSDPYRFSRGLAEQQVEKLSDLAFETKNEYVFAVGAITLKAVARHLEPAPLALDAMQLANVHNLFRVRHILISLTGLRSR
jgi:hypothetical protein